jgi:uncharacterized protein YbcI
MDIAVPTVTQQVASLAGAFHEQQTGHAPKSVAVVMSDDMLVITLRDALSPAELHLAKSPEGASQVQEFHRQLFHSSTDLLRKGIARITGRQVHEAAAEIDPGTGSVVHAFTTGNIVQVFQLVENVLVGTASGVKEAN